MNAPPFAVCCKRRSTTECRESSSIGRRANVKKDVQTIEYAHLMNLIDVAKQA